MRAPLPLGPRSRAVMTDVTRLRTWTDTEVPNENRESPSGLLESSERRRLKTGRSKFDGHHSGLEIKAVATVPRIDEPGDRLACDATTRSGC